MSKSKKQSKCSAPRLGSVPKQLEPAGKDPVRQHYALATQGLGKAGR